MCAGSRALSLVVLMLASSLAWGQNGPRLGDVLAIQEALQQAIERAEPSIACILVSRSPAYRRWSPAPPSDSPGQLGRFNVEAALDSVRPEDEDGKRDVKEHDLSTPDAVPESYGSGVVISETGLVLTNAHVVHNATKIYVRLPGGRGSWADIHASDPRSDLAVLRLLDRVPNLKPLKIGEGENVRKGQFVLSLSNPFAAGFRDGSPSASWGIVSNLRRRAPGRVLEMERQKVTLHHYGTLIQTDTRVNLGCSGGALLNLQGELIGLTTAIAALSGSETPGGYALPLDAGMRRIIEVLARGEEVEYGFLGVTVQADARGGAGVQLAYVGPGSPARRAGLDKFDQVLAIAGEPVRTNDDLFLFLGKHLAGQTVRIEVFRPGEGRRFTVNATLAKYWVEGPIIASRRPPARGGLRVDYTSILSQRPMAFGMQMPPEGVVIREVVPGSPADKAQLQVDKVITQVGDQLVKTPADFYREMAKAQGQVELTFLTSNGRPERVTLNLK